MKEAEPFACIVDTVSTILTRPPPSIEAKLQLVASRQGQHVTSPTNVVMAPAAGNTRVCSSSTSSRTAGDVTCRIGRQLALRTTRLRLHRSPNGRKSSGMLGLTYVKDISALICSNEIWCLLYMQVMCNIMACERRRIVKICQFRQLASAQPVWRSYTLLLDVRLTTELRRWSERLLVLPTPPNCSDVLWLSFLCTAGEAIDNDG